MNQDATTERPTPQELPLRREAIVETRPRTEPHRTVFVVIAGMALASLLIPIAIVATQSRPTATVITVENHVAPDIKIVEVPVADMEPAVAPAADQMLARDEAIGEPLQQGAALNAERAWLGAAASPGPVAVAAVWSSTELFLSRDDGRTFAQVLGGPGSIGGAAIDEVGTLFLVRDQKRLGAHNPDGQSLWRELPFAGDTLALTTGAGWLGWLGLAHDSERSSAVVLALSADGGQTWRTQSVAEHADRALMTIEEDGAIYLLTLLEDAAAPSMSRLLGHVDGRALETMRWPSEYADAWGLGADGWAYAIASECASADNAICAMGPDGTSELRPSGVKTDWNLLMHSNGAVALAVSGERLLRTDGARLKVVDERIPTGITALAVDGIDRGLAVVGQHLLRWSPSHGWRVVHTADGRIDYVER